MATKADFYDVLGVGKSASQDEIRRAYRKLARQYHPDLNKAADAEDRFKAVQEAYDVLKDEKKRAMYDRFGHAGLQSGFNPAGGGIDFGDMGDIFESFFGTATRRDTHGPRAGRDLQTALSLEFMEAVNGVAKEIDIDRLELCDECSGSGQGLQSEVATCSVCNGAGQVRRVQSSIFGQFVNVATCENCGGAGRVVLNPCSSCGGEGRARRRRKNSIDIPAGVDDGNNLRIPGGGDAGYRGGPPGDLFVRISVAEHETFRREGLDVFSKLKINVADAVLGEEFQVETVVGEERVNIRPGTQSGSMMRLRGKGVPRLGRSGRGDHYVRVDVEVPSRLTKRERQLYDELKSLYGKSNKKKDFASKVREALGG